MPDFTPDLNEWLARVEALAPQVQAAHEAMHQDSELPQSLLRQMANAGLFKLWLPEELGGYNIAPPVALKVIEAMAKVDGSAGWCMGPGNVSGLFAAYLPEEAAREIYRGDWVMNGAGSIAGSGKAVPVQDGFQLSGRWAFCTNSPCCKWYLGVFTVSDCKETGAHHKVPPDLWIFYFPAEAAEIIPTWDTGGLRGTASHDLHLRETIVAKNFGYPLRSAKAWAAAPMYAAGSKVWAQTAFAAVTLGIAKAAVEALTEIARTRIPTMGSAPMSAMPLLRDQLGRSMAALHAAECFFESQVQHCFSLLEANRILSETDITRLGQSCSYLADTSREVTQAMYRLGGGASVYRRCPLDRCIRDVQVAAQHSAIGPRNYDAAAKLILGTALA